jgi:hypothetical protein
MSITKVQITYFGKQALVDSDQVKFLFRKDALVKEAMDLGKEYPETLSLILKEIKKLNRKIRQNVFFL